MKKNQNRKDRKPQVSNGEAHTPSPLMLYDGQTNRLLTSMVHKFGDTLCLGYSPENWAKATDIIRDVDFLVDADISRAFGDMMAEAYTHLSFERVENSKKRILAAINERTAPNT